MKIGIESQRIFRKAKHGMDVVALELIRKIQQLDRENQYTLFANSGEDRDCITDTSNFRTRIITSSNYGLWEQFLLPAVLRNEKYDLLHCTANTAPLNCAVPVIITVHDVIYLQRSNLGGSFYQNAGNMYRRWVVPRAVRKAKKIVTVSEYEKRVIAEVCELEANKIVVIQNGVSERFHDQYSVEKIQSFRHQYKLPKRFILFHGNTAPKKNTAGAIKAYVQYRSNVNNPLPLVVTDYPRERIQKMLQTLNSALLVQDIHTPGYIPWADMPLLYNCCSLFLYPSLRESFGLPVLEAMACGRPVIAADIPAVREVSADAALLVDPNKPELMADCMSRLLADDTNCSAQIIRGLDRVKRFSWEHSARQLVELYRQMT